MWSTLVLVLARQSSLKLDRPLGRLFFVDEVSCVGCKRCVEVAPSTFELEAQNGRARVSLQNGDSFELIREAIRTCPAGCIHQVTHGELAVLEEWRGVHIDDLQKAHVTSRLVGSSTPPPWWLPLRAGGGTEGGAWHPIIQESRTEQKATVDFMNSPGAANAAKFENIEEEDALTLKHTVAKTEQLRSLDDWMRAAKSHQLVLGAVCLLFTLQGLEIVSNDVYL